MSLSAFEGIVENGRIRLRDDVQLPEQTKVYVIVPGSAHAPEPHLYSPRLAHPEQAADFTKQVIEGVTDAGV